MRKGLAAIMTAASAAGILFTTSQVARADTSLCDYSTSVYECQVAQTTAAGYGMAAVYFDTSTGQSWGTIRNNSGFSMHGWIQINYGSGYVTVWSVNLANGAPAAISPHFDDHLYFTRGCFQFTSWSGAAVHCSDGV